MIEPRRYFPWKISRHYFLSHLIFALSLLLSGGVAFRYLWSQRWADVLPNDSGWREDLDYYLISLFLLSIFLVVSFLFWSARLYFRPLGLLIQKARLLRRSTDQDEFEEEFANEELGEWLDLERVLNRIHKELRHKSSDLAREREELAALLRSVSDAILAIDTKGEPLFFNPQFALLFGAQNVTLKNLRLEEIFRSPELLAAFQKVLRHGELCVVHPTLRVGREEKPHHFSISVAPLKSQDNAIYGAVGIFHDVTEMKQAEQIRIEFVANASHELRTPLTSIKGYVSTVREDFKTGRLDMAPQFLDIIARNVDRLIFLVNDLLDLSTIESGNELKKQWVSTHEVTEAVLKQLEDKRALKHQDIQVRYEADQVWAHPQRLEQILLNLVHNAIKYIPEGKSISILWQPRPDAGTILRIKDNGPGVPIEHQARLFERFYRLDTGRSRDQGGTGLGLAIVKHIMIKHGGSIELISQPNQGSEFICHFP